MRLAKRYFCYGSLLTSLLWLSIMVLIWKIQDKNIPMYQVAESNRIPSQFDARATASQLSSHNSVRNKLKHRTSKAGSPQKVKESTESPSSIANYLPDLSKLAVIRKPEEQKLRSDGELHSFVYDADFIFIFI